MDFHEIERERQMEQLHRDHDLHHAMEHQSSLGKRITAGSYIGTQIGMATGGPVGALAGLVLGALAGLAIDEIADK